MVISKHLNGWITYQRLLSYFFDRKSFKFWLFFGSGSGTEELRSYNPSQTLRQSCKDTADEHRERRWHVIKGHQQLTSFPRDLRNSMSSGVNVAILTDLTRCGLFSPRLQGSQKVLKQNCQNLMLSEIERYRYRIKSLRWDV